MVLPIDILLQHERIFPGRLDPHIDATLADHGVQREKIHACILGSTDDTTDALKVSEIIISPTATTINDSVSRYFLVASTKRFDEYRIRRPRKEYVYSTDVPFTTCSGTILSRQGRNKTLESVDTVVTQDGRFFLLEGLTLKTAYKPSWSVGDMTTTYERKIMSQLNMMRRIFLGEEKK